MFIRTPRLFLRPTFPEDWRELFCAMDDAALVRMLSSAPWPYREQDARAFCERQFEPMDLRLAIVLPGADGAPMIGQIGLDCSAPEPELGYWIKSGFRGRGYAVEAVGGILEIARVLGVHRAYAGHYIDNPASGAVLRKCGFVETGEIRPTHSLGRGGEMVLARRYALDLVEGESAPAGCGRQVSRKPA